MGVRLTVLPSYHSMSQCWEHQLQQYLEADTDFVAGRFIKEHPDIPARTIRRRHAELRSTIMKRLQKRQQLGVQATTSGSLNTRTAEAAKGGRNMPEAQATKGSTGGSKNVPKVQATKGSSGRSMKTLEARAAKDATRGSKNTREAQASKVARNTPEAQATKGSTGGSKNRREARASKCVRNTPAAQATKGSTQGAKGSRNAPEAKATKVSTGGSRNTPEAQVAKGARNTPESQSDKGIVGGHGNTPETQHAKASCCLSSGVIDGVAKELFSAKTTSSSDISLKFVREYWLYGLHVLYSPLFDALCYRCRQLF